MHGGPWSKILYVGVDPRQENPSQKNFGGEVRGGGSKVQILGQSLSVPMLFRGLTSGPLTLLLKHCKGLKFEKGYH